MQEEKVEINTQGFNSTVCKIISALHRYKLRLQGGNICPENVQEVSSANAKPPHDTVTPPDYPEIKDNLY